MPRFAQRSLAFAALALEREGQVRVHVRHDERVGAFTALGAAKISAAEGQSRPAVVITTSGTASANLHPAVLEAAHANIPLIVLTADRPHELRGVGANQTTDQVGLFGNAARWAVDIPARDHLGDPSSYAAYLTNLIARASAAALGAGSEPGPVHVNLALREPLIGDDAADVDLLSPAGWTSVGEAAEVTPSDGAELLAGLPTAVLAGDGAGPRAREVAEAGGWPLFAEPSSGARSGPNAIGPYRLMLDDTGLAAEIERVIVFGHATLSRPVQKLLAQPNIEVVVVHSGTRWTDPARRARVVVPDVHVVGEPDPRWLRRWQEAGAAAAGAIAQELGEALNGPNVAQAVCAAARPEEILWFGSSNPVRDADLARPWDTATEPLTAAHRGLAGIDGTISAATGAALATGRPVRVLLGDLTFIHDIGALVLGPLETAPKVQIVVFDDNGGGIFETLEQGAPEYRADFERVFGTPHGKNLAEIARGFGAETTEVSELSELRAALAAPIPGGLSVIVVSGQRADRRAQNERLAAVVRASRQ